jgi:tetratricopeptide (TPR) repeat protein
MLFDLRGRGRRRTVQGIYLMLAVLMGGGLVLFGIGGATSGGLVDAISGNGSSSSGSGTKVYEQRVATARKAVQLKPADAASWAALTRAQYQLAGFGDNFDASTNAYTAAGKKQLQAAETSWEHYLSLNPSKVDGDVASLLVQAQVSPGGLGDFAKAAEAQEFVIDARTPSNNLYGTLSVYASLAGQTRKAELAMQKALELTPKDDRDAFKAQVEQAKAQFSGDTSGQAASAASG